MQELRFQAYAQKNLPIHQFDRRFLKSMPPIRDLIYLCGLSAAIATANPAFAQIAVPDQGKLLATGGVTEIEGAGGGGLTPWALITGYGTQDSYGANVHGTVVSTGDYRLTSEGVGFGLADRLEVSFATQRFEGLDGPLRDLAIREQVTGLKVRVVGNAVYDQDSFLPQIAVGAQYKQNLGIKGLEGLGVHNPTDLGAHSNDTTDYYVAATKILLEQSLLLNLTIRATDANQFGLLGAGGQNGSSRKAEAEGSIAYLASRKLAIGFEFRDKPRNLAVDDERAAYDLFVAYFLTKNISFTLAYVDLGTIVKPFVHGNQSGPYASVQIGF